MGGTRDCYLFRTVNKTDSKITVSQLCEFCVGTDNHLHHDMAETDPKSVQDLTNVVSRDRDVKLVLATVA